MIADLQFSTFPQGLFCGNARNAAIMEILSGFPQLLGKLFEFPTFLLKTLRVSNIPTKPYIFFYKCVKVCANPVRKKTCLLTYGIGLSK